MNQQGAYLCIKLPERLLWRQLSVYSVTQDLCLLCWHLSSSYDSAPLQAFLTEHAAVVLPYLITCLCEGQLPRTVYPLK